MRHSATILCYCFACFFLFVFFLTLNDDTDEKSSCLCYLVIDDVNKRGRNRCILEHSRLYDIFPCYKSNKTAVKLKR